MELLKVFNLEDVAHVAGIGLQLLDDGLAITSCTVSSTPGIVTKVA